MEAIAIRLAQLDTEAEGAMRVVMFFDTLMRRRVDLPALARATAGLAECVTGIRLTMSGRVVRVGIDGRVPDESIPESSLSAPIVLDGEAIGTVWLERADTPRHLDPLLLERLSLAVSAVVERYGPAPTTMADPALVELVISADGDEAARARALRLLGFAADDPVRVLAAYTDEPADRLGRLVCPDRLVKAATVNGVTVILAGTVVPERIPAGVRVGIGAVGAPAPAWRQARTALRFTSPREPVIHYSDLGALALLAEVPEYLARAHPDVAAIARLAEHPDDLDTLDVYCATGSRRAAAEHLHLHHSSVARRLELIAAASGIDLTTPAGVTRARIALATWRLLTAR